ncbi:hypothetical protein F511_05620 [Dorcoceras hygrometricum]|uniref:Uncharacterized protein n=1 Tax=Dorcoceras hygrometricum TaxID=472368 RepID=A0A2Z7BQJ4_9LAMI|nr:hypothetical protein F511_05620 [Dorcoceras hygrometricum]
MLATADILKTFLVTSSSFVVCNSATGTHLNECTCWFLFNMCVIPAIGSFSSTTTDLALSQNVVVSTYSSDTVLLSLKCTYWLPSSNVPAGYYRKSHLLNSLARRQNAVVSTYPNDIVLLSLTTSIICWYINVSADYDDVSTDVIVANPSTDSADVIFLLALLLVQLVC